MDTLDLQIVSPNFENFSQIMKELKELGKLILRAVIVLNIENNNKIIQTKGKLLLYLCKNQIVPERVSKLRELHIYFFHKLVNISYIIKIPTLVDRSQRN